MTTYTNNLRFVLQATGSNASVWGSVLNSGAITLIDSSIAGYTTIAMADANYTLSSNNGSTDEARSAIINATGANTATRNIICPTATKIYVVTNNTTGAHDVVIKTSAGTGVTIPNGQSAMVYCNGTNVVGAVTAVVGASYLPLTGGSLSGDLTGTTAEFSGAISATTFTGAVVGNASTASAWATSRTLSFTGDVTGSGSVNGSASVATALTIGANKVTNAQLAQLAASTIKGNNTGSPGNAIDMTGTQTTVLLDAVVGDSGSGGTKGLVPAPSAGDAVANKYLKASGAWTALGTASGVNTGTSAGTVPLLNSSGITWTNAPTFTAGITGTTTNDSASTGIIGEFQSSVLTSGSAVSILTSTPTNITSMSLTAGDWEVWGVVDFVMSGTTSTYMYTAVSSTSANLGTQDNSSITYPNTTTQTATITQPTPRARFSLASPTTVYLVGQALFSAGTLTGYGSIRARRMR